MGIGRSLALFLLVAGPVAGCARAPSTLDPRARDALILGSPPRIAPLAQEELTEEMRVIVDALMGTAARDLDDPNPAVEIPDMLATIIRHPALVGPHLELGRALLARGTLSPRDRELAVLRVAWLCGAPFEWGEHVPIAKRFGVSAAEVERIVRGSTDSGWSDHDRAIVRAVEELHGDAMISDPTWASLSADLDEVQLIELVMLVGQYQTVAYYQNALRLPLREGREGLTAR